MSFSLPKFFDHCRDGIMGPTLDNDEVSGAEAIVNAMAGLPLSWTAYALATAWHETAHSMQPVAEAHWLSQSARERYFTRMYDIRGRRPKLAKAHGNIHPGDGARFAGRGYVQLTWRCNYEKAERMLGVPLSTQPDLAMRPDVAADIMRQGMEGAWFTGRGFDTYLPRAGAASLQQFKRARRIINGVDKAALIAGYALHFQRALVAGGWR